MSNKTYIWIVRIAIIVILFIFLFLICAHPYPVDPIDTTSTPEAVPTWPASDPTLIPTQTTAVVKITPIFRPPPTVETKTTDSIPTIIPSPETTINESPTPLPEPKQNPALSAPVQLPRR